MLLNYDPMSPSFSSDVPPEFRAYLRGLYNTDLSKGDSDTAQLIQESITHSDFLVKETVARNLTLPMADLLSMIGDKHWAVAEAVSKSVSFRQSQYESLVTASAEEEPEIARTVLRVAKENTRFYDDLGLIEALLDEHRFSLDFFVLSNTQRAILYPYKQIFGRVMAGEYSEQERRQVTSLLLDGSSFMDVSEYIGCRDIFDLEERERFVTEFDAKANKIEDVLMTGGALANAFWVDVFDALKDDDDDGVLLDEYKIPLAKLMYVGS